MIFRQVQGEALRGKKVVVLPLVLAVVGVVTLTKNGAHPTGRIAAAGRLRVPERRAVELIRAAGTGAVLILLSMPPQDRDPGLANAMYDAVMRSILTDVPALAENSPTAAAVAFRTVVPELATLTGTERALLSEWLDRATG